MNTIAQLFSASTRLAIHQNTLQSALMEAFGGIPSSTGEDPKTYLERVSEELNLIKTSFFPVSEEKEVNLTDNYFDENIPTGSIAYHRIWGFITASNPWYFSSKQFERDLLAAEANPSISCHFIHANSGGGEAWYLDRLSETMRKLTKPVFVFCEKFNCSACYYITCHAKYIAANTENDSIGCIGTMVEVTNWEGWYEKYGIKVVRAKATKSDLKNKIVEDLLNGKPKQYIEEVLDPMTEQFLAEVRSQRPELAKLPEDDPVFRGATFNTPHAIENHLIDGKMTFVEAVLKAKEFADEYDSAQSLRNNTSQFF